MTLTGFAETKDALEHMQYCHDAFFPPCSVSIGPWYQFSYMIAMNIDLYGQLSDWFILWNVIHAYEADRSCVNTMTIGMNSRDCWYEHVIVNMNINITQMNECSTLGRDDFNLTFMIFFKICQKQLIRGRNGQNYGTLKWAHRSNQSVFGMQNIWETTENWENEAISSGLVTRRLYF